MACSDSVSVKIIAWLLMTVWLDDSIWITEPIDLFYSRESIRGNSVTLEGT